MDKKLIFILYDSRSGSTLLASLLNRYRALDVTLESAFVSRIMELNNQSILMNSNKLIEYLYEEVQFKELRIDKEELLNDLSSIQPEVTKKKIIQSIIKIYFKNKSKESKYWVIKHPPYNYIQELSSMFSEVKFVQIIRDGRAVFNSKIRSKSIEGSYMESNPIMAAIDWRLKIKKCYLFDNVTTIRYEDLIRDTESCLSNYLDSLKLTNYDREQTKDQKDYFITIGNNQKGLHQNVGKLPDVANINKWVKQLSKKEISVYDFVNKKVLINNGYDVQKKKTLLVLGHFVVYFFELVVEKCINIFRLIATPSKLFIKIKRRILLLK